MSLDKKTEDWVLWIKTVWTTAMHVAAIAVVLAMFHIATTSFETVVVAGLTMVYAQVLIGFELTDIALKKNRLASQQEFLLLARILMPKSKEQDDISDFEQDYAQTFDAVMVTPNWRWYIHFFSYCFISIIAVWNLVKTVIGS